MAWFKRPPSMQHGTLYAQMWRLSTIAIIKYIRDHDNSKLIESTWMVGISVYSQIYAQQPAHRNSPMNNWIQHTHEPKISKETTTLTPRPVTAHRSTSVRRAFFLFNTLSSYSDRNAILQKMCNVQSVERTNRVYTENGRYLTDSLACYLASFFF